MSAAGSAMPEAARQPNASAAKSQTPILKLAVFALILIALTVVAIGAGVIYIAHRTKGKIAPIQKTAKAGKGASDLRGGAVSATENAIKRATESPLNASTSSPGTTGSGTPANLGSLSEPLPAIGDPAKDWALKYERTVGGPEADLVVRTGDINNLGFGWPKDFDPFSGKSTPPHPFPWKPRPGAPDGTDRILIPSVVTPMDVWNSLPGGYDAHDGYSEIMLHGKPLPDAPPPQERLDSMPKPITLTVGALPAKINEVLFQIFLDDFQVKLLHSHFQVTLNGTRIPSFEAAVNSLDQTGPIGKLVALKLLPEYWPLLQSSTVKLFIDDPTTHVPDGYAIDFVRILVNPHTFKYQVSLTATVVDADKHKLIADATVSAALESAATDRLGKCQLERLPAGLVVAIATAPGYDSNSVPVDIVAGQTGNIEIQLHRHDEGTAALERAIAQSGSATIYGIHFNTDSAKLRPDSTPALNAVFGLISAHPGSRWIIAGHTDNQGETEHNQPLSEARAASVVSWMHAHGVSENQLVPQGFGESRPVADNATANGRALNRRVEIAPGASQK
jgi:OOP family OmpA-OmpF porin